MQRKADAISGKGTIKGINPTGFAAINKELDSINKLIKALMPNVTRFGNVTERSFKKIASANLGNAASKLRKYNSELARTLALTASLRGADPVAVTARVNQAVQRGSRPASGGGGGTTTTRNTYNNYSRPGASGRPGRSGRPGAAAGGIRIPSFRGGLGGFVSEGGYTIADAAAQATLYSSIQRHSLGFGTGYAEARGGNKAFLMGPTTLSSRVGYRAGGYADRMSNWWNYTGRSFYSGGGIGMATDAGSPSSSAWVRRSLGSKFAIGAGAGAAAAGIGLIAAGVPEAARLEENMRRVATLSDEYANNMGRATRDVQSLVTTTGQSQQALSYNLFDVVSAGFRGDQATDVLERSAMLATAGFTDLESAIGGTIAALKLYEREGLTASQATDVFFKAQERGITTIGELVPAFADQAASLKSLGVEFKEQVALLSALTLTKLPAQEVATGLRALGRTIINPSDESIELQQQLGIDFSRQSVLQRGLAGTLEQLRPLTAEQVRTIVPEERGYRAVAAFRELDPAAINAVIKSVDDASGATDKALGIVRDGLNQTWTELKNNFGETLSHLGSIILPGATLALKTFSGAIEGLNDILSLIPDFKLPGPEGTTRLQQGIRNQFHPSPGGIDYTALERAFSGGVLGGRPRPDHLSITF